MKQMQPNFYPDCCSVCPNPFQLVLPVLMQTDTRAPSEWGRDLRQPFLPNASSAHDQPTARPMLTVEICRQAGMPGSAELRCFLALTGILTLDQVAAPTCMH